MSASLLLALLFLCTLSLQGIVSLWASYSPWHWFARLAVVLVLLTPLLLAEVYSPWLMLLLQTATVVAGLKFAAAWRRAKEEELGNPEQRGWRRVPRRLWSVVRPTLRPATFRFSIATLLLLTVPIAVLVAVAKQMPELNGNAWLTIGLIGFGSGGAVLLGDVASRSPRKLRRLGGFLLVAAVVAIPLACFDSLVISLVKYWDWPPIEQSWTGMLGGSDDERPGMIWLAICPLLTLLTYLWCLLSRYRPIATLPFGLLVPFPLYVLWILLQPPNWCPPEPMPNNGYDRLVEVAGQIVASQYNNAIGDWDIAAAPELMTAVDDIRDQLTTLPEVFALPSRVPVSFESADLLSVENMQNFRHAMRALCGAGRVSLIQGQPEEAARYYRQALPLGAAVRRGGLLIDGLVGIAIAGVGGHKLYQHRHAFSPQLCRATAAEILTWLDTLEPYDDFRFRDRAWTEAVCGWHGRLCLFLEDCGADGWWSNDALARDAFLREQALLRLVATELALQAYYHEHQAWPPALAELVPAYLPHIPTDPFDQQQRALRYQPTDDGYLLYSVSCNGIDEDGNPHRDVDDIPDLYHGDLLLRDYWKREPVEPVEETSDGDAAVEMEDFSTGTSAGNTKKVAKDWQPQRRDELPLPNVFQLTSKVLSGGEPTGVVELTALRAWGVQTVISVDGAQPPVELARQCGLRYVHLPHGYDGVPEEMALQLAKAVQELPGPVYIHCHHGKHRSPAAAAVACIGVGQLTPEQGKVVLQTAGTSEKYRGLWESVAQAEKFSAAELDAMPAEFPEVAQLPPLVTAMVALEQAFDHMEAIEQAGWQVPAEHPDLDPPHEALLLREQFTELLRTDQVQQWPDKFKKLLRESEQVAAALEAGLRAWSGPPVPVPTSVKKSLAQLSRQCQACHRQFRDLPLGKELASPLVSRRPSEPMLEPAPP